MDRYGVVLGAAFLCGVVPAVGASSGPPQSRSGAKARLQCPGKQETMTVLARASSLMEEGKFQMVIDLLEPGPMLQCQVQADLLLAGAFNGLGDVPSEVETLQRAQKRWPADTSVGASLAHAYLSVGMVDKAAASVQHCAVNPHTPLRELQLIESVYIENHDLTRAREVSHAAYTGYPSEETLLLDANILQLEGRYMDVIALLGKVRLQYDSSSRFLITLAESEYDAQMYQATLQDVSEGVKLDNSSYAAHYVMANTLVKTGNLEGARSEYERAIRLSPSQPRTYYRLALAQEMQQDTSAAQTSLAQAIAADEHYAPAYGEMGKLLLRQDQYQQAVDQLTKAIQYNPSFDEAYFLLVQAYARLGDKEKSAAALSQWNQLKARKTAHPVAHNAEDPSGDFAQANR